MGSEMCIRDRADTNGSALARHSFGQALCGDLDRLGEPIPTECQNPNHKMITFSQSNSVADGSITVGTGVLSRRQYNNPEVSCFASNDQPVEHPGRPGTFKVSVPDGHAILAVGRRRELVDGIIGQRVKVVAEEIGTVVILRGQLFDTGLFSVFVDLHLFDDHIGIGRGTDATVSYTHLTLPTKA